MAKYIITGGVPLKGNVKIYGAKNVSFKIMLAAVLADEPSVISNICFIRDVIVVKRMLENLGAQVSIGENKTITVIGKDLNKTEVPSEFGPLTRASSMVLPVLLHRFKKAIVPLPGGDQIGARTLDWHLDGLRALGAKIAISNGLIQASAENGLIGTSYKFTKNTHTGTETMILASCLAKGTTVLENAAQEPEINDLINFLNKMGADISRLGNRRLEIKGVDKLHGANWSIMPDQNEAVTFACAALATKGDVFVETARSDHMLAFLDKVNQAGGGYEITNGGIRVFYKQPLKATSVETSPYPGFKTDWQALWVTLMTQAQGESIVHERVFESRFGYTDYLKQMGAKIELFNPSVENPEEFYNFNLKDATENSFHAAKITGPTSLTASNLAVNDIRAGATLTLAALVANGQSVIDNIELIERGYENLEGRLGNLGANIVKKD